MKEESHNGWKNRSTWLVKLHLDNTSKDLYTLVHERAVQANTKKQFTAMLKPILLESTPLLWKEKDFDILRVDFNEIWDVYRITN